MGVIMNNIRVNAKEEVQDSLHPKKRGLLSRPLRLPERSDSGRAETSSNDPIGDTAVDASLGGQAKTSASKQMTIPGFEPHPFLPFVNRRFTFGQFVVGPTNRFAYKAALTVANKKGNAYNPLYFFGESGLGKSHLSGAIGNHILETEPATRIVYVTAEEFVSEMVSSIREKEMWGFKEKYRRRCDILFIDGVHFLSGKEKTQSELSHTLDHLYHSGKRIILTANVPPHKLSHMTDGLKSRLGCGLVVDIQPPDFETRKKILRSRAEFEGTVLPDDVVALLASGVSGSIRRLEGLLINLIAKSSLLSRPIEIELAQEVIRLFQVAESRKITIDSIQKRVAEQYQIEVEQLTSRSRRRTICHPRQMAMYFCRKLTGESLDTIGKAFFRDHASVIHSIGVIERQMREKAKVRREIDFLMEKLRPQHTVVF
jgi:chromosomal replication initiator protein